MNLNKLYTIIFTIVRFVVLLRKINQQLSHFKKYYLAAMKYLLLLGFITYAHSVFSQSTSLKAPTPYYVWQKGESKALGILYKVEQDSFYVIPKAVFFAEEERFLEYPNSVSSNFLKAYPLDNQQIKGRKKNASYFYTILGAVVGAGVGLVDVVRSYRACDLDPLCNIGLVKREREFSDGVVVGIGAATGLGVGIFVGSLKSTIPMKDKAKIRRYTIYREF